MSESANSVEVERFVCIGSHHLNMTIICLVQNLFQKGKVMRTLILNIHYFVLYKNRRDQVQIQRFGRQAFPQKSKYFLDAYLKATFTPYGYLLVDLNHHSCKPYSLRSRIFPGEELIVYRPSDEETDLGKYIVFAFCIVLSQGTEEGNSEDNYRRSIEVTGGNRFKSLTRSHTHFKQD